MFNLNWCRNICHEGNDDGTISGKERIIKGSEAVPLHEYLHQNIYIKKTINPAKPAVIFSERILTFSELDYFSSALAVELKLRIDTNMENYNPERDFIIAICLPPSEKFVCLIFAIHKLGAAYLPLEPSYPEDITFSIIERFHPLMIVSDENGPFFTKFDTTNFNHLCTILTLEDVWLGMNLSNLSLHMNPTIVTPLEALDTSIPLIERPAVILQTTDISSDPRGVRISHLSILNQLNWSWRVIPFHKQGASLLTVPVSVVASLNQIFAPLLKGVTLHILARREELEMDSVIRRIGEKKITRIYLSSELLRDFLNECYSIGPEEIYKLLPMLTHVICQGEVMPKSLAHLFFNVFPHHKTLTNTIGCTELSGDVILETFSSESDIEIKTFQRRVAFGKCIDNTTIYIKGIGNETLDEWNQGEICVSGCPVSMGYVNENDQLEHSFVGNDDRRQSKYHTQLYRTGFYGRMVRCYDDRLRLYVEGRGDEIIRQQGYEFNVDDVRNIIGRVSTVHFMEAVIFHQGCMDQAVVAFVVPFENDPVTVAELDFDLRVCLPDFMIPEIQIVESLPLALNKTRIDTSALIKMYQEAREPNDEVWTNLVMQNIEIYEASKVLMKGMFKFCSSDVKTIVANMDLTIFDLGVTSMNIVCLNSYLISNGYEIHLRELLAPMSIHEVIHFMAGRKEGKGKRRSSNLVALTQEVKEEFVVKVLDYSRSKEAFRLIATAYTEKGELESYNLVRPAEFHDFLSYYYNAYKEQSICFFVTQKPYDDIVAVCLAHDFFTDFNIKMNGPLMYIIDIEQEIKGGNLAKLPHKRNKILELFMVATHQRMTSAENVQLTLLIMGELVHFAERENFTHIYVNTTNQFIKDLCTQILGYTVIDDFPVRDFIQKDGFRPFRLAPTTTCITSLCCRLATVEDIRAQHKHREEKDNESKKSKQSGDGKK